MTIEYVRDEDSKGALQARYHGTSLLIRSKDLLEGVMRFKLSAPRSA
jgi:hypothetical protein